MHRSLPPAGVFSMPHSQARVTTRAPEGLQRVHNGNRRRKARIVIEKGFGAKETTTADTARSKDVTRSKGHRY